MDRSPLDKKFWLGEVDARPLALFRVLLGLVVLWDVGDRLRDFHVFYTDAGLFARAHPLVRLPFSLAWAMGEPWQVGLVFALAALGALGMVLGAWTRWSTILTLIALLGIQHRNPFVLDGGDVALRVLLFWSVFVDLGAVASLDARWRGPRSTIAALPVRLLQLQIVMLHCLAGIHKNGTTWRDGTAVFRALQDTTFARDTAALLLAWPLVCMVLTYTTLVFEIGAPFLIFAPWQHRRLRALGVLALHALHFGIFCVMRVGLFSLVMQVALIACWRAEWMPAWRGAVATETRRRATMLWWATPLLALVLVRGALGGGMPRPIQRALDVVGLSQRWSMFAPNPPSTIRRWHFPGTRTDGTTLDVAETILPVLVDDRPVRYSRWAKFKSTLANDDDDRRRVFLGSYLCRRWKALRGEGDLQSVAIDVELEPTRAPLESRLAPSTTRVFYQPCLRAADPPHAGDGSEHQEERDEPVE